MQPVDNGRWKEPDAAAGIAWMEYAAWTRTSDPMILALDCLATDFFHSPAYPTTLCYNPYATEKRVAQDVGPQTHDLYDAVSGRLLLPARADAS